MFTSYVGFADHYFRVIVQKPLFHCLSRDEPRPIYDAAKTVIESLSDEDRAFIEAIYSHSYDFSQDATYLNGVDGHKWRKRLSEIHKLFALKAGII